MQSRAPIVYTCAVVAPLLALCTVCLRFYVRHCLLGGIGTDDWLILGGMILLLCMAGSLLYACGLGYGRHISEIDPENIVQLRTVVGLFFIF